MTGITLPTDDKPSRIHKPTPTPIAVDDVAQTLAEYEWAVRSSASVAQIDPPEFSHDGSSWAPYWLDAETPPAVARATVHRDGVPTTVYAVWREVRPSESAPLTDTGRRWCDIWDEQPMQRLGSYVVRAAIARAFRDVIGDRREPGESRVPVGEDPPRVVLPPLANVSREMLEANSVMEELEHELWAQIGAGMREQSARMVDQTARKLEVGAMPEPEQRPARRPYVPRPPAPEIPKLTDGVKPVSRKASSRAQRDTGKRGGGKR